MIQRYHAYGTYDGDDGPFVDYADHLAALAAKDAEIERLRDRLAVETLALVETIARTERAEAEAAGLRADAERYRVARAKVCIVGDAFHVINLRPTYVAPDAAIEFDAALDAARGES